MAKLFVGGLPWATTSEELQQLFANAGSVISAVVIMDKMTGRSKGFGFVEMSDEDGEKAKQMYDGQEYGGRTLVVNEARPMEPRAKTGFGGGNGGGGSRGGYGAGRRDSF
jgi:RNA recognition motif-containing protein